MRKALALVAISALALISLTGCARGPIVSADRDIDEASSVVLDTSGTLTIREGEPSLVIRASSTVLDRLTSTVRDGELRLGVTPGLPLVLLGEIRYELTLPSLERIEINGSGDVDSDVRGSSLAIEINGSGDVEIANIDASTVSLEINGSGDVSLDGRTDDLAIRIGGSADVGADALRAAAVTVEIDGSADVTVAAADTLDIDISGSGSVRYVGRPEVTQDISGAGDIGKL